MSRSVKEWIGKTDDSRPPASVEMRILRNYENKCHISGRTIRPGDDWHVEHIKPLWAGGENRESNLAPALVEPHKEKTKVEAAQRAKADAAGKKAYGRERQRPKIQGAGFRKAPPQNKASSKLTKWAAWRV